MGGRGSAAALAEVFRNLALLIALYRLFAADGRHQSVPQIRLVILALGLVELLLCTLRLVEGGQWSATATAALFEASTSASGCWCTIGGLVLVHNLYAGASHLAREQLALAGSGHGVAVDARSQSLHRRLSERARCRPSWPRCAAWR